MNTEKLISKNDIDNAYDKLINIISNAYSDISRLNGINSIFDIVQYNMCQVLKTKLQNTKTMLNKVKNETIWDNLVIAFFGDSIARLRVFEYFCACYEPL